MFFFDTNFIFQFLIVSLAVVTVASGALWLAEAFFVFRSKIKRSMNLELDIVRVSRVFKKKEEKDVTREKEAWKDEVGMMEQLLTTLTNVKDAKSLWRRYVYGRPSIVFEIAKAANNEEIIFYVAVPRKFAETVEKQITSYFPNASIEKSQDYSIFTPGCYTAEASLALKHKFILPLRTYEAMEADPLNEISNSLSKLDETTEGGVIQLVLAPMEGSGWRKLGIEVAHKMQQGKRLKDAYSPSLVKEMLKGLWNLLIPRGKEDKDPIKKDIYQLTPDEQELVKAIERKSSKPAFRVNVRLLAAAPTQQRAEEILSQLENAFVQFEYPEVNHFAIRRRTKSKNKLSFDYIFRNFDEEESSVLGAEEISGIFHFPISSTETPKIKWLKAGAAPPPPNIPKEGILMGYNDYRGMKTDIRMSDDDRRRHLYVIGQTGVGKTTMIKEMCKQDIINGKGVCFIDPHGDDVQDILACVPISRAEDVVYFDPADMRRPFGLNMMEYDPAHPEQKTFVINEMINIFDKLYDLKQTGGPIFEQYMRNAMLLVMDSPESGSTLMEIPKVLADADFRKMKLAKCKNPIVVDFWVKEAEKAGGDAALANVVPYVTSKLTTFIANDMMRPIIAQQHSTLNFREIMDSQKILLINLSKGRLGEINSYLLGMVVVGKLLMAALGRADTPPEKRYDFYLYIDEFQNVTTNSVSQILSEARKYKLDLIIAHQFIGQLSEDISKAVFGNVGSIAAFRVGPEDAEFLEKQLAPVFTANDLANVDNRNCFVRLMINNESTKPFNMKTYPPMSGNPEVAAQLKELSSMKYGRDAEEVNQEIMKRARMTMAGSPDFF
ncbi:hypothetical protein EPO05_02635 [Patescibacteria group bacterium]|nr:MAG: hypothetical protein EPO05_02635 [Patescibacteria group bacterium]